MSPQSISFFLPPFDITLILSLNAKYPSGLLILFLSADHGVRLGFCKKSTMFLSSFSFPLEFAMMATTTFVEISGIGLDVVSSKPWDSFGRFGKFDHRFKDVRMGSDPSFSDRMVESRSKSG